MLSSPVLRAVLWSERHPCTFTEQHAAWGVPWGDGQWVTVCLHAGRCVSSIFSPSPWSSRPASPAAAHVPCIGRSGSPTPHPPPPPPPPPAGMCAATCTSRETCARGNSSPSRSSSLGSGKTGESMAPRAKTMPTVSQLMINSTLPLFRITSVVAKQTHRDVWKRYDVHITLSVKHSSGKAQKMHNLEL